MHQNLLTLKNMENCKKKYDYEEVTKSKVISSYNLQSSKYEIGQWVDVKDTIDQWLEAQIINIQNNQAYVHYNGWGNRWDEWIDFSSSRIAPFKYVFPRH
jgi:RNA binding activity-knot of a chromodomain